MSRKLKEKEERKMKGEVRLRKERKVITAKTTCINRQIFFLPHVTNPLFVISLDKVAILTHPLNCITLWPNWVIRLYKLEFGLFLAYFLQRFSFVCVRVCVYIYILFIFWSVLSCARTGWSRFFRNKELDPTFLPTAKSLSPKVQKAPTNIYLFRRTLVIRKGDVESPLYISGEFP